MGHYFSTVRCRPLLNAFKNKNTKKIFHSKNVVEPNTCSDKFYLYSLAHTSEIVEKLHNAFLFLNGERL